MANRKSDSDRVKPLGQPVTGTYICKAYSGMTEKQGSTIVRTASMVVSLEDSVNLTTGKMTNGEHLGIHLKSFCSNVRGEKTIDEVFGTVDCHVYQNLPMLHQKSLQLTS